MMRDIRLGDDIDDFCVRCKRVMNHNVVSVLNGQAAKVRCRTCHSDHDFRHEQAPPPKVDARKAALFAEVLKKVAPGDAGGKGTPEDEPAEPVDVVAPEPKPKPQPKPKPRPKPKPTPKKGRGRPKKKLKFLMTHAASQRIMKMLLPVEKPLPHGRGSDRSRDRKGAVSSPEHPFSRKA